MQQNLKYILLSFLYLITVSNCSAQQFEFCKTLPTDWWFVLNDMELDAEDNIYLAGHFQGRADFDPSEDSLIVDSYFTRPN